jgi:beta-phosphoglucomutase
MNDGAMRFPSGVRAVIFDIEGVVLDTDSLWDRVQSELLARYGRTYDRDALKPMVNGLDATDATEVLKRYAGLHVDARLLARERHDLMARLLADGAAVLPGARDYIDSVRAHFAYCAATSMHPDLFAMADRDGAVSTLFQGRVYTSAAAGGRAKPAPDVFRYAADRLGVDASECLVVEDAPYGIAAARAAGMRCIALATTHQPGLLAEADLVCADWAGVPRPEFAAPADPRKRQSDSVTKETR